MKVLLLNITGRFGSTGKIVNDIKLHIEKKGNSVLIAYGHPDYVDEEHYIQIDKPIEAKIIAQCTKLGRAQYKGNPFALKRLKEIIFNFKPDVVHIHCINGLLCNVYKLFDFLASNQIKTVITHHAEFFYTGSCAYSFECENYVSKKCIDCPRKRYSSFNHFFANPHKSWVKMYDAIQKFNPKDVCFVSVSPWVFNKSMKSPIVNKYCGKIILNGVNTRVFCYQGETSNLLKGRIPDLKKNVIIHVTHLFKSHDKKDIKGGGYVTEIAKRMPNVTFVIVASDINIQGGLPPNLFIWGRTENRQEMAQLYSAADLTIITSRRETFSMVVAESLCCGTPVIGFEAGGPETIAIGDYCRFVKYGDCDLLTEAINGMLVKPLNKELISKTSKLKYSDETMGEEYLSLYKSLISGTYS